MVCVMLKAETVQRRQDSGKKGKEEIFFMCVGVIFVKETSKINMCVVLFLR